MPNQRRQTLFIAQVQALKITGFIPFWDNGKCVLVSVKQKCIRILLILMAVTLICGNLFYSCLNICRALYGILYPHAGKSSKGHTGLLHVMDLIPASSIAILSSITLIVLFIKRNSWANLAAETSHLINLSLQNNSAKEQLLRKAKRISIFLLIVSSSLHFIWQYTSWLNNLAQSKATLSSDNYLSPVPIKIYAWQNVIITSFFRTLPFVLSQQVYICSIILVLVLSTALHTLEEELNYEMMLYATNVDGTIGRQEINNTKKKLQKWECLHVCMLLFVQSINEFFGWTFFTSYVMDVLTMSSWIVSGITTDILQYTFAISSVVIFGLYATLFPLLLVGLYERVNFE
jgi:hypothetical protein